MAGPWEQYQTTGAAAPTAPSADGPWAQYQATAPTATTEDGPWSNYKPDSSEGPGLAHRLLNATNEGLSGLLAAPGSIAHALLGKVGIDIPDPMAAADRLAGVSRDASFNPQSTGEKYGQAVANAVGSNAVPLMGTLGAGLRVGASSLNPIAQVARGAAAAPGAAIATDVAASVGQGVGGETAKDAFPGNPYAEVIGQLAGGLSVGALAHTVTALFKGGATADAIIAATKGQADPAEIRAAVAQRDKTGSTDVAVVPKEEVKASALPEAKPTEGPVPQAQPETTGVVPPEVPQNDFNAETAPQLTPEQASATVNSGLDRDTGTVDATTLPANPAADIRGTVTPEASLRDGPYTNDKMASNVNSQRLGTDEETRQYLGEALQDSKLSTQTHPELVQKANDLLSSRDTLDILGHDPKASELQEYHLANRAILKGALDKMKQAAAKVLDPNQDTTAAEDELNKFRYLTATASARVSGDSTLAGQLLESRKIMAGDTSVGMAKNLKGLDDVDSKTFAHAILEAKDPADLAKKTFVPGWKDHAANVLNVPRSLMSSFDLSAPFRQGLGLVHKKEFWNSFSDMFKHFASEKFHEAAQAEIKASPNYQLMQRSKLYLAGDSLSTREEAFLSPLAEKIPVVGRLVRASDRAYTGFLNKLRADTFNNLIDQMQQAGMDVAKDKKATADIAKFINTSTGRGDMGKANVAAPLLASVFFSPRLIASRVQMLNPAYYVGLSPIARQEALKSLGAVGAFAGTTLGLAALAGAHVETDPRSTDFAKVRVGNTRLDTTGGFGSYLRLAAIVASNQKKTGNGDVQDLGSKFGTPTRFDTVVNFGRGKFSPLASIVGDYLAGKDVTGQPFSLRKDVASLFVPMIAKDMAETYQDAGLEKALVTSVPDLFGISVNTYSPNDSASRNLGITQMDDPVRTELHNIQDPDHPFTTSLGSLKDYDGNTVKLSKEQKDANQKAMASVAYPAIKQLMQSPSWKYASTESKREAIKDILSDSRESTKDRLGQ